MDTILIVSDEFSTILDTRVHGGRTNDSLNAIMGNEISIISIWLNVITSNVGYPSVQDYLVLFGNGTNVGFSDGYSFTVIPKPEESSRCFASRHDMEWQYLDGITNLDLVVRIESNR